MPSDYVTVFQVTDRFPDLWFACVGLIALAAGLIMVLGKRRFKRGQPHWVMAIFFCGFGIFWTFVVGSITLSDDLKAFSAYKKGDYRIVEGAVTNFRPMPFQGHQDECFSVQEQRFCYSDYAITPGFHNATSHGGPINEGLPVRIAYRDGNILRLEIPSNQVATPMQSEAVKNSSQRQFQEQSEADPFQQRLTTAFLFAGMCWTLWWNVQWKQAILFWTKPSTRSWVRYLFRIFFALCFIGTAVQFIQQLKLHPLTQQTLVPTMLTAVIMCAVISAMTAVALWMAKRRDRTARSNENYDAN